MRFWSEYSHSEVMSMHGIEEDEDHDEDSDDCQDDDHECEEINEEPCCGGRGCKHCLMTEW